MDLKASIAVWLRMLGGSHEEIFAEELQKPYARLATAVIWLVAAGLVAVLVWILVFMLLDPMAQYMEMMPQFLEQMGFSAAESAELVTQMENTAQVSMFLMLCGLLVGIPGLALAWSGALWLVAKLLGGSGNYGKQTFLLASFITPLVMVSVLLYLFPLLGPLLVMGLLVYGLYLTYFAVKVVHGLPAQKAFTAVAAPVIGFMIITCCVGTLWLAMLGAALGAA